MMRIEAIRDRTNERNQTHQAKSTRAVGSNAGSFGKSSRWRHLRNSYSIPWRLCRRRHTLPESTWLGSIIPAVTDDMGGGPTLGTPLPRRRRSICCRFFKNLMLISGG